MEKQEQKRKFQKGPRKWLAYVWSFINSVFVFVFIFAFVFKWTVCVMNQGTCKYANQNTKQADPNTKCAIPIEKHEVRRPKHQVINFVLLRGNFCREFVHFFVVQFSNELAYKKWTLMILYG